MATSYQLQECMNAAVNAAFHKDWRLTADNYRWAYETRDSFNEGIRKYKYRALAGFCSIFFEGQISAIRSDLKFLKKIATDESVATLIRTKAYFALGFVKWSDCDKELALLLYREAIAIGTTASDFERRGLVMDLDTTKNALVLRSSGSILEALLVSTNEGIAVLEGHTDKSAMDAVINEARLANRAKVPPMFTYVSDDP